MSLTCKYCFYYFKLVRRKYKQGKEDKRLCGVSRKWIRGDETPICSRFLLKPEFWCDRNNQWKKLAACLNNREITDDCLKCRQFDQDISQLINLMLREGPSIRKGRIDDYIKNGFKNVKAREVISRNKKRKVVKRGKKKGRKIIRRR